MRWGKRRRGVSLNNTRTYHDTVMGAAGRGDIEAMKNIKRLHGVESFPLDVYKAALLSCRYELVDWLVKNGVDFWPLLNQKLIYSTSNFVHPYPLLNPRIVMGLRYLARRETKYYFVMVSQRDSKLRRLPEEVVRYLLDWV